MKIFKYLAILAVVAEDRIWNEIWSAREQSRDLKTLSYEFELKSNDSGSEKKE